MIILKIAMVGVAIVALMAVARDQRWFERSGVVGTCYTTPAPRSEPGGSWYACKQGLLSGFPNLEADTCSSAGVVSHQEIWRCSRPLGVTARRLIARGRFRPKPRERSAAPRRGPWHPGGLVPSTLAG